jgi:hypothetical protein
LNSLHDFDGVQIGNLIFLFETSHPATKHLTHILAGDSSANGAKTLFASVAVVESLGCIVYLSSPSISRSTHLNVRIYTSASAHPTTIFSLSSAYMGIPRVRFEVLEVGMWPRRRRRHNVTSRHLYSGSTAGTARELKRGSVVGCIF